MSAPPWMPFYIRDYLADTPHLTTEQHGAYLLLMFAAWQLGGILPDDDLQLAAITRLPLDAWRASRFVLARFFKISGQKWHQKRLSTELERALHLHDVRSTAGSKGGAKPKAKASRATQPQPQPQTEAERVSDAKAKPQASNPKAKKPTSEPSMRAPARANGAGKEDFADENWKPAGRYAPLAAPRPSRPQGALKARRKELLRQKLLRFIAARLPADEGHTATLGLCGGDPEHSEQWWLDHLDILMRAQKWDDTEEFWGEQPG